MVDQTFKRICSYALSLVVSIKFLLKYVDSLKLFYKQGTRAFGFLTIGQYSHNCIFLYYREKKGQANPIVGRMMQAKVKSG